VSKALEYSPRNPDHATVLADLDPELDGLAFGIPAGVLRADATGLLGP
jgi:hypothetical protein